MGFEWAITALKNGHEVRRQEWREGPQHEYAYLYLERELEGFNPTIVVCLHDGTRGAYRANDTQLLAEDWELN